MAQPQVFIIYSFSKNGSGIDNIETVYTLIIKGLLSHFCGFNPFLSDKIDYVLIHIHSSFLRLMF